MGWPLPENVVLGLAVSQPGTSEASRRLAETLGPGLARRVQEAMLLDFLNIWGSDSVLAPGGRRVVLFDPPESGPWFDKVAPKGLALQPRSGSPSDGILQFVRGEVEDGAERVVVLGVEALLIDPASVVSAFLCLEGRDVVLGPAPDGGVTLFGLRRGALPRLEGCFKEDPATFGQVVDQLEASDASLAVLPFGMRVCPERDLVVLRDHIRALRRAGIDPGMPLTEELFRKSV